MICVLTNTEIQALAVTFPASFSLLQVYLPSSVDRTFEINKLPSSSIWSLPLKLISPSLKYQVTFGCGAASASHAIVASFPSNAVWLWGLLTHTGDEAGKK